MYKSVLFLCAQALMIQSIASQCIGAGLAAPYATAPWAAAPWAAAAPWEAPCTAASLAAAAGPCEATPFAAAPWAAAGPWEAATFSPYGTYGPAALAASNGGGLRVSSASPFPASGVSILSENVIEGPLFVAGALPFLGTVALEGVLPTAGAGAVNYGCGNGAVAILAEEAPAFVAPFAADAYGYGPYGFGPDPIAAETYGYGPYGPLAGPYPLAGCGCDALI